MCYITKDLGINFDVHDNIHRILMYKLYNNLTKEKKYIQKNRKNCYLSFVHFNSIKIVKMLNFCFYRQNSKHVEIVT